MKAILCFTVLLFAVATFAQDLEPTEAPDGNFYLINNKNKFMIAYPEKRHGSDRLVDAGVDVYLTVSSTNKTKTYVPPGFDGVGFGQFITEPDTNGYHMLLAYDNPELAMEVQGCGTGLSVVLNKKNGSSKQLWQFLRHDDDYVVIKNKKTRQVMTQVDNPSEQKMDFLVTMPLNKNNGELTSSQLFKINGVPLYTV